MANKYKGITFRSGKNLYEGRFQCNGQKFSVYGKTQRGTLEKMEELKHEVKTGLYCKPKKITLDSWFHTWNDGRLQRGEIKETTHQRYDQLYAGHISPKIGKHQLPDILTPALKNLIAGILNDGKQQTAQLCYIVLNELFKEAVFSQLITINPMSRVRYPKAEKTAPEEIRVLTREEQDIFIRYASKSQYFDFWMALLQTGTRINEMTALRWQEVDMTKNEIRITGTMVYIKGSGRKRLSPKTKAGKRTIPILPKFKEILQRQRKEQLTNRMALGSDYKVVEGFEDACFQYPDGGAIWAECARHDLERINNSIQKDYPDFEPIHPHTLRHTFATRWIEGGGDMKTLQTILGHSTFAMTMDLYSHVLPNKKQSEMLRVMGDLF